MEQTDPSIVVAVISIIVAGISLVGTLVLARSGERSAQLNVSDKIAIGSSELLEEYRTELKKERASRKNCDESIVSMQKEIDSLQKWKKLMTAFIFPLIEGSKANEAQIIELNQIPRYKLPEIPKELFEELNGNDK